MVWWYGSTTIFFCLKRLFLLVTWEKGDYGKCQIVMMSTTKEIVTEDHLRGDLETKDIEKKDTQEKWKEEKI